MTTKTKCDRCGGHLTPDEDGDLKCVNCGRLADPPKE